MAHIGASRSELLEWINNYFNVEYSKIEQCGNGEIYCLIFNALYPNTINISRLQKNPKTEFQILTNYKLLQNGFNKVKISRDVNVDRLMKCRLQDNLEFLQWFGKLWCEHNEEFTFGGSDSGSRPSSRRTSSIGIDRTRSNTTPVVNNKNNTVPVKQNKQPIKQIDDQVVNKLKKDLAKANEEIEEIAAMKQGLEIERNFYFNKLRDMEILCQQIQEHNNPDNWSIFTFIQELQHIMYLTEDGFLLPDGDKKLKEEDNFDDDNDDNNDNDESNTAKLNNNENKKNISQSEYRYKEPTHVKSLDIDDSNYIVSDNSISMMNVTSNELLDDETF